MIEESHATRPTPKSFLLAMHTGHMDVTLACCCERFPTQVTGHSITCKFIRDFWFKHILWFNTKGIGAGQVQSWSSPKSHFYCNNVAM